MQRSLDYNNNSASISHLNKQTTSTNQFKIKNFTSTPLNLITENDQQIDSVNTIVYTRPPVLKHQPKTNSLSSTTSSSGVITGSSFDSNLSIENLTSIQTSNHLLTKTNSIDKLTCDRILSAQLSQKSQLFNSLTTAGGKIPKLSRNLTEHKINTSNFNKIHKISINQRSQSQDNMNYNIRSSSSGIPENNNGKTNSIANVSDVDARDLNKELELLELKKLEVQLLIQRKQQEMAKEKQHEKIIQEKRVNFKILIFMHMLFIT